MEQLEIFVERIEKFGSLPSSLQIDFFVYFLLESEKSDGVTVRQIAECFEYLYLSPHSNIASYLTRGSKKQDGKFLKKDNQATGHSHP